MVARQDRNVEGEGKCDWCPVVGVSGHPSARRTLHVLIERPGYDLDHVALDEVVNDPDRRNPNRRKPPVTPRPDNSGTPNVKIGEV